MPTSSLRRQQLWNIKGVDKKTDQVLTSHSKVFVRSNSLELIFITENNNV